MTRGMWSRETVALFLVIAMMPLAVVWLTGDQGGGVLRLLAALVLTYGWQLAFLLLRAQPPSLSGIVTALAVAMLAPSGLGPFAFALGVSFGVVLGELAFGGWGRNILNPATVAISFLGFGYPTAAWPDLSIPLAWGAGGTLVLAALFGLFSIRLVAGAALALAVSAMTGLPVADPFIAPAIGASFVLLVCDPATSASTQTGRWLHGLLYGGLVAMFLSVWTGAATVQLTVSAALIANLAAPLLDEFALLLWRTNRRRHHG